MPNKNLTGRRAWESREWRQPHRGDSSCITDAGFNGGPICSFNLAYKYTGYLGYMN